MCARASGREVVGYRLPAYFLLLSSYLSLSRLCSRASHLRSSPSYQHTSFPLFCAHLVTGQVLKAQRAEERRQERNTRDGKKLMELKRNDTGKIRRLGIRISSRLSTKEHLLIFYSKTRLFSSGKQKMQSKKIAKKINKI